MTIEDKLLEIATYTLPALITGGVAFVMMQKFYNSEESKRKFELLRENQKQALPIRLQAYERMKKQRRLCYFINTSNSNRI